MSADVLRSHPDLAELRAKYDLAAETPIAQTVDGLTVLTGVYLAISPWVVGFERFTSLTVNNLIVGVALAVLALGFAAAYGRTHGLVWVAPVLGAWTIIAPWVVRGNVDTTATIWNNVIAGAIALVLGFGALAYGMSGMNGKRRWRR